VEAITSLDADKWQESMRKENESIKANGTYKLVPLPPGKAVIVTSWVYKIKKCADGSIEHYKACFIMLTL